MNAIKIRKIALWSFAGEFCQKGNKLQNGSGYCDAASERLSSGVWGCPSMHYDMMTWEDGKLG